MKATTRFDLPVIDRASQPFWQAAERGQLLIRRCLGCDRHHFYPRPFCPTCWSDDVEWVEASGRATVYTYSVVRVNDLPPFDERVPYVAAIVDLEEAPRMMTNIVDVPPEDVHIGMAVEVTFVPRAEGVTLPLFRPATPLPGTGR